MSLDKNTPSEKDFHKQNTLPDLHAKKAASISIPKKIGPYKIESLLNKGGMSFLYLAVSETGVPVALKVLVPKFTKDKEAIFRFLKEAKIIKMTNHPNIVKLYGEGEWERGLYIAMEFVQGISLRQFIEQKSLSLKRALEIVLQVAHALLHLHSHKVIHRDLKPENILMTETGEIKVIDFGIAQVLDEETKKELFLQKRRILGTPVYMSPEQKTDPESVTFSSDIYSLGVIAYELILGKLSHGSIHLNLLPQYLRKVLEKSLKEDPKNRYQDIVDFMTDIASLLKEPATKESSFADGYVHFIQESENIFLPQKITWPHAEIGFFHDLGLERQGKIYLDSFEAKDHLFLVLAEPKEKEESMDLLTFRSLFRATAHLLFEKEKEFRLSFFAEKIEEILLKDRLGKPFFLQMLLLDPQKDRLSFLSCNSAPLVHLPEASSNIKYLSTPNPHLKAKTKGPFLETSDNWNINDTLYLFSKNTFQKPKIEKLLKEEETLLLAMQPQAEKIISHLALNQESFVLSLRRIF